MTRPGRPMSALVRSAGWTVIGLAVTGVVRFVARYAASAAFGVAGLGLLTAAMSVATIATIPGPGGLSPGITKLISELRGREGGAGADHLARRSVSAALILATVAAIAGGLYATVDAATPGVAAAVAVGMLTLCFGAYTTGKAVAFGQGRIRRYALAEVGGAAAFAAALGVVIVSGRSGWVPVALAAAYLPVAFLSFGRIGAPEPTGPLPVRELVGYGMVGTVGSFTGVGFTYTTPLAAGVIGGIAGTALIGACLALLEPLTLAPRAIGLVLLPELSEANAANRREAAATALLTGTRVIAAVAVPACALLLFERNRLLGWIFTKDLVGGATFGWLIVAFLVSVIGAPAVTSLAAIRVREASISMVASLIGFGAAAVCWVALGGRMGVAAVGFGYLVGSVIQVAAPLWVATRRYGLVWGSFWPRLAVAGAGMGAGTLLAPSLLLDGAALAGSVVVLWPELRRLSDAVRRRG